MSFSFQDPLQVVSDEYLPNVDHSLDHFDHSNSFDAFPPYHQAELPEGTPRLLRHAQLMDQPGLEEPGDGSALNAWHGFLMRPSPTHTKRVSEREINSLLKNTWVG